MRNKLRLLTAPLLAALIPTTIMASSHMDAPLITFDDPANTTDVYAFLSEDRRDGDQYLTTAVSVYPFEEPGIGPNTYRFDDRVIYRLHVALDDNVSRGVADLTYGLRFNTEFQNSQTILQNYLGPIGAEKDRDGFFANQNLRQSYTLDLVDRRAGRTGPRRLVLGDGAADGLIVPPNNQGLVTTLYNIGDDGDQPAKHGVARTDDLDPYTQGAIAELEGGYQVFAGQRDDGFFADIQSIFDLDFSFGAATGSVSKPFDSQGGFNVHTIVVNIPMEVLGDARIAGVWATTHRVGSDGRAEQVARQGNPLFAEALVAIEDKDAYNQTMPRRDARQFAKYAEDPELGRVLGISELIPGLLRSIYVPDVIKVDLTTGPARLAGDPDFDARGVFGGDLLQSTAQDPFGNGGLIPGGWPNGRRFGDDVLDIALIALGAAGTAADRADLTDFSDFAGDRVNRNDITYNQVFPYAATPLNGRNHPLQQRGRARRALSN